MCCTTGNDKKSGTHNCEEAGNLGEKLPRNLWMDNVLHATELTITEMADVVVPVATVCL